MRESSPTPSARRPRPWLGAAFVSAAVLGSTLVAAAAVSHVADLKYRGRTVGVTGSATRRIRSDRVIWKATVVARSATLAEAYRILQNGTPRVHRFLLDRGVPEREVSVGSVASAEVFSQNEEGVEIRDRIVAYDLSQTVSVTSADIERVRKVSQDVTQLIQDGVDVRSESPEYIYTGLGNLKVRLIAEATGDARTRALRVARNTGSRLGPLVSARVGVVQVNAANQSEVSWDGVYDRTAIEKDAMVAVNAVFAVE